MTNLSRIDPWAHQCAPVQTASAPAAPDLEAELIPGLVALSPTMRNIVRTAKRLAGTQSAVLLRGETGTGKELIARAIHDLSPRANRPFVVVDSGALSPTLLSAQLFGHERGAFTGAEARHQGAFELARDGTLFLDEIGDLPLAMQPALLGVLERRSFRRLGGREDLRIDVRVISATNRDLEAAVAHGEFRADLYFRLAAARIDLPPLRDRPEDIGPLVKHFAGPLPDPARNPFSEHVLAALRAQRWPGNIRELRNVVENILTFGGPVPESQRLPTSPDQPPAAAVPYREARRLAIEQFERRYVSDLIKATGGNASAAARLAGMDRPYLLTLLRKHGLR
jgi:DNA-binding NtrC family response regulator